MRENEGKAMRGGLRRIIALLAALIVIGGSQLAFAGPKTPDVAGFLGVSHAQADGFKTLKKGSSGAPAASQALTRDDIQAILESTFCDSILLCWKREETSDTISLKGGEAP